MSQVVTLYKDKEKTDALYPRTKVSAISDDNNTSLQELLNRNEVIDNLTSYETDKALSANQGRELNDTFKNYYDKTEVNNLLDNIDVAGMVKQEEGGIEEGVITPTNADTLGGKLTANNVVFYEEEIVNEVGQVVLRNADLLENHPASYFATSEELNTAIANGTLHMDLLWENASPTSAFTAQTISLDLSQYKAVIIQATWMVSWVIDKKSIFDFMLLKNEQYLLNGALNANAMRKVIVGESNIQFDNAYYFIGTNTDNTTQLNELLVPKRIYGVR